VPDFNENKTVFLCSPRVCSPAFIETIKETFAVFCALCVGLY